jgi:hypothetical protein
MPEKLMILPSKDPAKVRLLAIPEDLDAQEAFRHATGVIAASEEENPGAPTEEIYEALEERGFRRVEFVLGPALD